MELEYKSKSITGAYYISFLEANEVNKLLLTEDEVQEIRFFKLEELEKIRLTPVLKKYFTKYKDVLKKILEENYIPNYSEIGLEKLSENLHID